MRGQHYILQANAFENLYENNFKLPTKIIL